MGNACTHGGGHERDNNFHKPAITTAKRSGMKKSKKQPPMSDAEIDAFLSLIRPLDLIVFCGAEGVSKLITKLEKMQNQRGDISHVEMCITTEWCTRIKPKINTYSDTLLSWGSTMSGKLNDGVNNIETGESTFGVQVRDLRELVKNYSKSGNIGVCRLINNPIIKRESESDEQYTIRCNELVDKINAGYDKYNGATYDINPLSLFASIFPDLRWIRSNWYSATDFISDTTADQESKWLFCSEFVAVMYIQIGIITDGTDGKLDGKILKPADVIPVDFVGADVDSDGMRVAICESPPIWLKPPAL